MQTSSTHRIALALAAALLAASCGEPGGDTDGAEAEVRATPETRGLTEGLALWRADGFTLLVPEDADIVPSEVDPPARWGAILAGPGFYEEGEGGAMQPGPPAYRLDVATYEKPDTVAIEAWVSARIAERGEAAGREPLTIPIAGEAAVRTGAAPGEVGSTSYWLERDGVVVELRLEEEPESPLSEIQRHMQSLILSTFRWSAPSGTATPPPDSP